LGYSSKWETVVNGIPQTRDLIYCPTDQHFLNNGLQQAFLSLILLFVAL